MMNRLRQPAPSVILWPVQWMRAAAALLVVVGHTENAVAENARLHGGHFARSTLLPWGSGVDLFFVISGFIMVHASRRLFGMPGAPATFLRRRVARIVPLYWLATTLFLALLALATWKGGDPFPTAGTIAASYAFLPYGHPGSGIVFPVFDLGWTLNYEMFFYALFATVLAVRTSRTRSVLLLIAAIGVLTLIGAALPPGWIALGYWTRPIIGDFALGLAIGLLMAEGARLAPRWRWSLVVAGTAILLGDPFGVFAAPMGSTIGNGWLRVVGAGVPAAAVLAGAVLGPEPIAHRRLVPLSLLGDASYSLYLFHPFVLIGMGKLAQKSAAFRMVPGELAAAGAVGGAVLLATIVHARIERPVLRAFAARRTSQRPPHLRLNLPRRAKT